MACRESYIKQYEPAETSLYKCPLCGYEAEVAVIFDLASGYFYPERIASAICPKCKIEMDRQRG